MSPDTIRASFAEEGCLGNVIETLYATGYWLYTKERYADAAAAFRVLLQAAPTQERSWLALGECHEKVGHLRIALELLGSGTVAAAPAPRCMLARARVLRTLGRGGEADDAFDEAQTLAEQMDADDLVRLVDAERRAS